MKTFEQLKEQTTPEIIRKIFLFATGFNISDKSDPMIAFENEIYFPLLLHRAVEGFNKIELSANITICHSSLYYDNGTEEDNCKNFLYSYYTASHLTPCEMAILDCLIEVLK